MAQAESPGAAAPVAASWIVLKFGGTSVSTRERWERIAALARVRRDEGARVLIVVSAMSGATDALKEIAEAGANGEDVAAAAAAVVERHRAFARELEIGDAPEFERWVARLETLAKERGLNLAGSPVAPGILPPPYRDVQVSRAQDAQERPATTAGSAEPLVHPCTSQAGSCDQRKSPLDKSGEARGFGSLAWQAEVLALGELMLSGLGLEMLRRAGLAADWLDARDWLMATDLPHHTAWARRCAASCASAPNPQMQATLAQRAPVLITQGYIARASDGGTAVLGRGGSDTSASYFGALLKAMRVEIWSDVAGMFSGNPRQVRGTRLLRRLDYEEAQEIATTGAKVLHPRCLSPLREARVPLLIRDTNRPDLPGTEIGPFPASAASSVKAISYRAGITLVSMETVGMWQQVGFLADVFAEFKRHGLSIDLIGSAETNVTVSLDPSENLVNSDVLGALCTDLARVCRVRAIAPCAAITLVGRGMRGMLDRLAPLLAEFGRENVYLISQSSNNLNLTFVVDEALAAPMLPRLHELLVKAGAMRVEDETVFGPTWESLYEASAEPVAVPAWWRARRAELLRIAAAGTPRYVYELASVRAAAMRLRRIAAVDRWLYAMKANAHPEVLRTILDAGFDLECVSQGELEVALQAAPEKDAQRVLFTPNFAPRAEYAYAYAAGTGVTIDNLHVLREWPELMRGRDAMLRLDLGHGAGHHDKVVTGGAGSKFGVTLADLSEVGALVQRHAVRIVGLHAHLGSGILDVAHFRETYAELATLAERFPGCAALNIGGGLGVPARPDETPLDLDALAAALAEVKRLYPQYALWMEPGRYLVADAGVLIARVTQLKRKGEYRYVGIDAGMNSLLRPALYEAWHPIFNLSRLDDAADTVCQVVGPICESGDVLGQNRRMAMPREGDVLLIAQAGAYGAVMASHYNLRAPAAEVVL